MKFTVTTEVDPASDTRCGSCPQIRAGKDHDHCRLFDDAVLVFDSGHWRTDKCVIAGQRAELALLRASRAVTSPPADSGYLGFRVGARPIAIPAEHRADVPMCVAGCKLFSDGWDHHRDCRYAAWMRGDDLAVEPAPPALLDLRTVRMDSEHAEPDTLIANADLYDTGRNPTEHHASVEKGEKFTVERVAADHGHGPRVKVLLDGGSGVFIAAMQPAHVVPRVVKHACPRCDEGMREIIIEWDQDSVQTATRLGADGTAIVEIGSESTIYTPNAYRFVRADVPPPSEWCDGKGSVQP